MRSTGLALALAAFGPIVAAVHGGPKITIGCVEYQGVHNATTGINAYYGIKYAETPSGSLRWRPPVPLDPGTIDGGLVNATTRGPSCIQSSPPWQPAGTSSVVESEDCLLLDVLTPQNIVGRKLPVMVNIHGGEGYAGGTATPGDSMVYHSNGSMIYVALQYRLGPLGFLAGDDVAKDGSWNVGLLDQRLALEWVREYIHYFGGDPERVTITGGSAGGGSVAMQMILHGGEDNPPFRAAIPEYPWMPPMYSTAWLNSQFSGLLSASSCQDLACLRGLPIQVLREAAHLATETAYNSSRFPYGTFYWGPAVDGNSIRDYPVNEFQNGHFTKVPVLLDRDMFEGVFFTNPNTKSEEEVARTLKTLWQISNMTFIEELLAHYPPERFNASLVNDLRALPIFTQAAGGNLTVTNPYGRLQHIVADIIIDCPSHYIASAVANAGQIAHKVIFNAGSQLHGATAPFLFSSMINSDGTGSVPVSFPNATLASYLRDYFVSFALHLDPNRGSSGHQRPYWPRFTADGPEVLRVDFNNIGVTVDPESSSRCTFLAAHPGS